MLSLIVPFCCDGVGQTTLIRKFKLDVFGVETYYSSKSEEISNDNSPSWFMTTMLVIKYIFFHPLNHDLWVAFVKLRDLIT
jgi:hypothetical protein